MSPCSEYRQVYEFFAAATHKNIFVLKQDMMKANPQDKSLVSNPFNYLLFTPRTIPVCLRMLRSEIKQKPESAYPIIALL